MTLIAVHRLPRSAVFLSDARLTETSTSPADGSETKAQGDEVAKFIDADNRIRLFAAGPVSFWQDAAAEITLVADQITLDNVDEMNGPLHEAVGTVAASRYRSKAVGPGTREKPPADAGALGFVLDPDTESNRVVSIEATFGLGAEIEEVDVGESRLIGSGSRLPGLRDRFHRTAAWMTGLPIFKDGCPDSLVDLFNVLRQDILAAFQSAGPGAHAQFNTGSVFIGGVLLEDWACLIGEELHDFRSSSGASVYTLTGDEDGLVVQSGNDVARLAPLSDASTHVTQAPLDPQRREARAGLQAQFPDEHVVYHVVQWNKDASRFDIVNQGDAVRRMIRAEARAYRSVYRTDVETRTVTILASFKETAPITSNDLRSFPDVNDYYFPVSRNLQDEFESGVADHAFDHDWWRRFVPDYDGSLFIDPEVAQHLRAP